MIVSAVSPTLPKPIDPAYVRAANATLTPENRFMAWADSDYNIFLTGMAGTGKSYTLKSWMDQAKHSPVVTAPTGVAALNVGGMTIHRWAGIGLGPKRSQSDDDYYFSHRMSKLAKERITSASTLIIDEISMLPGRQIDYLNFLFKRVRCSNRPFGGIQVIATGDFLQLPPVRIDQSEPYDWAFNSAAWEEAEFKKIVLTENKRQAGDDEFVRALAGARMGELRGNAAEILQARIQSNPPSNMPRLFTHNVMVDKWNRGMLSGLPGEDWVHVGVKKFAAGDVGEQYEIEALERSMLTPQELRLKPGAMVMTTVNNSENGTVNGQLGFVTRIEEDVVWVETNQLGEVAVTPWRFSFNFRDKTAPSITQYPLRLAYAMTIHKAQGLTMDSAYIDIRAAREPGQAYVALSRVRGLNGMVLKDWPSGIFVSQEAKKFYEGD